jgi:NRAMP (natural resistance-associated macrophage protein)-like metal ion transporter
MHSRPNQNQNKEMKLNKYFGPSTLIAAAFIGPGTITTCTIAGVRSGYTLLWVLLFSVIATVILQEMAARIGFITRQGLGEALVKRYSSGISKLTVLILVTSAILIGNAAYEAGNISGSILGMELIAGKMNLWPMVLGIISFIILWFGGYKWLERILIMLVLMMSICFLATVIIVQPNVIEILKGFIPQWSADINYLIILGLLGTTIVPYNLFLHASTISKKWNPQSELKDIRIENTVSIVLGGIISMMIVITASASSGLISEVTNASDLALQLEPIFGNSARVLMGIGLLAAGLSSTLTTPIAAAYVAQGLYGWSEDEKNIKFRAIWISILVTGVIVSMTGLEPIPIIKFAQITNAIVLPFIAIFLIYVANSKKILQQYTNGLVSNILSISVVIITLILSVKTAIHIL